jgi:hypothetical protein
MNQKAKSVSERFHVEVVVMFSSTNFCAFMDCKHFNGEKAGFGDYSSWSKFPLQ